MSAPPLPDLTPTTRRQWASVTAVAAGTFALVSAEFLPVGMLGDIAADLDVSDGTAGLLVTLPGLTAAIASPVLTVSAGRVDRRLVLLGLSALLLLSDLVSLAAPDLATLLVARFLLGLAIGGFWAVGVTTGVRLVAPAAAGRATSVVLAGISLGTLFGVPAGSFISAHTSWRVAFVVAAAISAVTLVAQLVLVPALPTRTAVRYRDLVTLATQRRTLALLVVVALGVAGHFAAYSYIEPYLTDEADLAATTVTLLLLVYAVSGLAGNTLAGVAVGRSVRRTAVGALLLLAASVGLLSALSGYPATVVALLVTWGLAFGAVPTALQTWVFTLAPSRLAEGASSLLVFVFQAAIAVGAFVGGRVVDLSGTGTVLAVAAGLVGLAAVGAALSPERAAR